MHDITKPEKNRSMTDGPIWSNLIYFAIPLLLGSLFQQFYNTADSLIVGNFLGDNALAAVSSSSNLIVLLVDLFNGLFTGAGILVANTYGSRDRERLSSAVHTTVAFGVIVGIVLTILGNLLAPVLLRWMNTPEHVMGESLVYFRIYFSGSIAFIMYNCCTGILRNVGDSVHPLMYLVLASLINVVLDMVFVGILHWGIASVALATIISQGISAVLCFRRLCRIKTPYQVFPSKIRLYKGSIGRIMGYGIPAGVQSSVVAFANVMVQSSINIFGAKAIAGCGVGSKLQGFALLPILSISMALGTFVGQNKGAKKYERLKKGTSFGILCCSIWAVFIGLVLFLAAPFLTSLFSRDPEIIAYSTERAHYIAPFFLLLGVSNCIGGILRGAGKVRESMLIYLVFWCIIRVAFITIGLRFFSDIHVVYLSYPVSWFLSTIVFLWLYRRDGWIEN